MVAAWVEQTPEHGGLLFAVDGQPDNTVARKRFWEGTFLFASGIKSSGPGFKAFRPIVRSPEKVLVGLPNGALADDGRFAHFSGEQAKLDADYQEQLRQWAALGLDLDVVTGMATYQPPKTVQPSALSQVAQGVAAGAKLAATM
jgi:hypothetical protein